MLFIFQVYLAPFTTASSYLVDETIRITDVKDFPVTMWLLCIICVMYYVAVFPFIGLGL